MKTAIPDLKWCFLIDPAYSWFEDFVSHFSSPDVQFIADQEDDKPTAYAFSSMHLSELDDEAAVRDRAASLKSIFDGAFYLLKGGEFRPFQLGDLCNLASDLRYGNYRFSPNTLASPFSPASSDWIFQWQCYRSPFSGFISSMLWLAREDDEARGMLQFLGLNGCSWIALYALLDFMRSGGMTPNAIAIAAKSTEAEINRFKRTANNFAAIGPLCRHGELGYQPPAVPMRLDEAYMLLLPAAKVYLLNRLKGLAIQEKWEGSKK